MKKIAVLVVLYKPDEVAIEHLVAISDHCKLYIYDNGGGSDLSNRLSASVNYYNPGRNDGISTSLLWMAFKCRQDGIKSFLFFDQDTRIKFSVFKDVCELIDIKSDAGANLVHFSSENKISEPRFVINSGTLYNVQFIIRHKSKLEKYFVDAIDLALSMYSRIDKVSLSSYRIDGIDHYSGQGYLLYQLLFLTFRVKSYSFHRRKEFFRGHFRLLQEAFANYMLIDVCFLVKFLLVFLFGQLWGDFIRFFGARKP